RLPRRTWHRTRGSAGPADRVGGRRVRGAGAHPRIARSGGDGHRRGRVLAPSGRHRRASPGLAHRRAADAGVGHHKPAIRRAVGTGSRGGCPFPVRLNTTPRQGKVSSLGSASHFLISWRKAVDVSDASVVTTYHEAWTRGDMATARS